LPLFASKKLAHRSTKWLAREKGADRALFSNCRIRRPAGAADSRPRIDAVFEGIDAIQGGRSLPFSWHRERMSVHVRNLGILAVIGLAWCTVGLSTFLLIHIPIVVLATAAGSWLFFVQHQYEHAYWQPHQSWNFTRAAFEGSSYYRLPRVLQRFTGNIGFHHIHHLNSRIPNYNLPACYKAEPDFRKAVTLGIRDSLKCASLKLWDEQHQRMATFKEVNCGRT
jgi:fatty acid desaturase